MSEKIVIVDALRTAVGSFNGSLASMEAHQIGTVVLKALMERNKLDAGDVDEVILGQVLTAGKGQNPARQTVIHAGLNHSTPAMTVNQVCGSGLRAVALGAQAILSGDASIVVVGGQESMSRAPHAVFARAGLRMGNGTLVDTMVEDGLTEAFHHYHMGVTAENIAKQWSLSRDEQDQFACASQNKAEAAQKAGKFTDEIIPVSIQVKKETVLFAQDEGIRAGASIEALAKLKPVFQEGGTVTAGNASGINDGAAMLLLMSESEAKKRGLTPLATIASWAHAGVDPAIMGTGPIPASKKALAKAGWDIASLDLIEANEAFAAQALCVGRELGVDPAKVNVNGGAIAIGHPIGASGARVLVSLLHEMRRRNAKRGLATLCIGGGMGIALCVSRD